MSASAQNVLESSGLRVWVGVCACLCMCMCVCVCVCCVCGALLCAFVGGTAAASGMITSEGARSPKEYLQTGHDSPADAPTVVCDEVPPPPSTVQYLSV